jgi:hypothetical protein
MAAIPVLAAFLYIDYLKRQQPVAKRAEWTNKAVLDRRLSMLEERFGLNTMVSLPDGPAGTEPAARKRDNEVGSFSRSIVAQLERQARPSHIPHDVIAEEVGSGSAATLRDMEARVKALEGSFASLALADRPPARNEAPLQGAERTNPKSD